MTPTPTSTQEQGLQLVTSIHAEYAAFVRPPPSSLSAVLRSSLVLALCDPVAGIGVLAHAKQGSEIGVVQIG
jgi:hypothetical protein